MPADQKTESGLIDLSNFTLENGVEQQLDLCLHINMKMDLKSIIICSTIWTYSIYAIDVAKYIGKIPITTK